jgi:hypothetical protein
MSTGKATNNNTGALDPQEKARVAASITGKEQAPSTRQQSAEFANWRAIANSPADQYNVERIPISMLRQMRRDPMISFATHFVRTPIIRAPWYIKCTDAQVAAFIDYSLRKVYARLVYQYMLSLDFGFSAIAKKFVQEPILDTYFDPNDPEGQEETPDDFLLPGGVNPAPAELQGAEKPIWSEGSVLPWIWAPFVPLPPEDVEPIWNKGEFDGIKFTPRFQVQSVQGSTASNEGDLEIDLYHSLWITNERDSVFGNIFGYPRIGPAFNYWWSYWQQHALYDRHFEKDADPPTVVRHPEGNYQDPNTGDIIAFRDLALDIGDRVRAGSTIAIPSEVYANLEDRPSNMHKWDLDYLQGGGNFEAFIESFDYLNVMKLRAVWVPEQALIEGKGGQSSRNVADTFGDAFQESQAVLLEELDLHINRYVIPQLIYANFPEFEGKAEKVTRGFSNKDVETMRQLIQLVGQNPETLNTLPIDVRAMLEDFAIPLMDVKNQAANAEQAARENTPGAVPAIAGEQAGIVPTGGRSSTNPQQGGLPFSYVQPPERIELGFGSGVYLADEFVAKLPNTIHYQDKIMKSYASQLYRAYHDLYRGQYDHFADFLAQQEEGLELSISEKVRDFLSQWNQDADLWARSIIRFRNIYNNVFSRAGRSQLDSAGLSTNFSTDDPDINTFITEQLNRTVRSIASTLKNDIGENLTKVVDEMPDATPDQIATRLRQEVSDYPTWQATRAARTEIRDLFNGATLLAGQQAGVTQAQAVDARFGKTDEDCEERDGEIFSINEALEIDEHPNGTLAWKLLPTTNLSVVISDKGDGLLAAYEPETETIYVSDMVPEKDRKAYIRSVTDELCSRR